MLKVKRKVLTLLAIVLCLLVGWFMKKHPWQQPLRNYSDLYYVYNPHEPVDPIALRNQQIYADLAKNPSRSRTTTNLLDQYKRNNNNNNNNLNHVLAEPIISDNNNDDTSIHSIV